MEGGSGDSHATPGRSGAATGSPSAVSTSKATMPTLSTHHRSPHARTEARLSSWHALTIRWA